jgi:hypothetical protein
MAPHKEPTDAEVIAELTSDMPLSRYCVIAGSVRSWVRLKQSKGGAVWLPLTTLIEDNLLARVAVDALLRAGVRSFDSVEEAVAWSRTQSWSVAESGADPGPIPTDAE